MKRHGNLWDQITTIENIELAYKKAKKRKVWRRTIKEFEKEKGIKFLELQEMLVNHTYKTSPYREKIIYEPKKRKIYILPFYPDRIAQHAVMNIVAPIWNGMFIEDSYSCREDKGPHAGSTKAMQFVRRNRFCLQCDVSKFYPSIHHATLLKIIERKIKDKNVLNFFEELIRSMPGETNVPIGNYTSQWLGNLYMNELDQYLKHEHHVRDYIRYCDDFLLFSNNKAQLREWGDAAEDFVNNTLHMKLSKKSLFHTGQGVDFLGYRHFPSGKILVRKSTAKRQKQNAKEIPYKLAHEIITKEKALSKIGGITGWLKWANSYNLSNALELVRLKEWVTKYDGKERFDDNETLV